MLGDYAEIARLKALYLATGRDKDYWKAHAQQLTAEIARLKADFECATKSAVDQGEQVLLLKAALRWCLQNGASVYMRTNGEVAITSETAESYGHSEHVPPDYLAAVIAEAIA